MLLNNSLAAISMSRLSALASMQIKNRPRNDVRCNTLIRCLPRGWSGAGVGVGMFGGAGESLTWTSSSVSWFLGHGFLGFLISWSIGLLVCLFVFWGGSWFVGFLICWLLGFKVSWFQSFKINDPKLPEFHFMFFDRAWSHIQDFQYFIRRIVGIYRRHPPFSKSTKPDFLKFRDL